MLICFNIRLNNNNNNTKINLMRYSGINKATLYKVEIHILEIIEDKRLLLGFECLFMCKLKAIFFAEII
jgi:hypothetical protein